MQCEHTADTAVSMIRTYSELIKIPTFEERVKYLKIRQQRVGEDTFGYDRWLNQAFYRSQEWKDLRREIFIRDHGYDLAMEGFPLNDKAIIHHLNPITKYDLVNRTKYLLDPEYLVSVNLLTHNAIHYSDETILFTGIKERQPNDTCPWRM